MDWLAQKRNKVTTSLNIFNCSRRAKCLGVKAFLCVTLEIIQNWKINFHGSSKIEGKPTHKIHFLQLAFWMLMVPSSPIGWFTPFLKSCHKPNAVFDLSSGLSLVLYLCFKRMLCNGVRWGISLRRNVSLAYLSAQFRFSSSFLTSGCRLNGI